MRKAAYLLLGVLIMAACSSSSRPLESAPVSVATSVTPEVTPTEVADRPTWRKERYIPVHKALKTLRAHVDLPVALPRDRLSFRNYRGWLADPRYLEWHKRGDQTVGTIQLRKRKEILTIEVGYSSPDGCGGRETAITTKIGGETALVWSSPNSVWSHIVWPVEPRARTGVYGLAGTFEGWQIVRLARSMHRAAVAGAIEDDGC